MEFAEYRHHGPLQPWISKFFLTYIVDLVVNLFMEISGILLILRPDLAKNLGFLFRSFFVFLF